MTNGMLYELIRDFKADMNDFKNDVNRRFEQVEETIRDFKDDVNRRFADVDKRFESMDKRFEGIDKRFEGMDKKFDSMETRFDQARMERMELREMIQQDRQKLNEVYEARNTVSVSFSRAFVGINLVLSGLVSGIVSFFVSR